MKKSLKFLAGTCWILFSRSYDAYCTYQLTPNLSKEANPLVSVLGIDSWPILLGIIGSLTLLLVGTYAYSVFKPFALYPSEKHYSFKEFIAFIYLGRKSSLMTAFFQFPSNKKRLIVYCGKLVAPCLMIAGIISTVMWLLIKHTEYYKFYHNHYLIYFILVSSCLAWTYRWHKTQYALYRKL